MKPLGLKEKNDLFFKYLVIFTITVSLFLFALFSTQAEGNKVSNVSSNNGYSEYLLYENQTPEILNLMDTVTGQANKILTQNNGGQYATQSANGLINEFVSSNNINLDKNALFRNITDLLSNYVKINTEKKRIEDRTISIQREIEECKSALRDKQLIDGMKQSSLPATSVGFP